MSAESSKHGGKRAKKQHLAAIIASRQERSGDLHISNGDSNSPSTLPNDVEPNTPRGENESSPESPKKNSRGKAKMLCFSKGKGKGKPIAVDFNEKGQPIGDHAAKLASCLGIIAKELLPMNVDAWKNVKETYQNEVWELVTQKFILDDCRKKFVFQKLGKHWRDHRSKWIKKVMEEAKVVGLRRAASSLKPDTVESMTDWQAFVKSRMTPEHMEKCKKFSEMRSNQNLLHRTSRKGFARLEDEMRQESENSDAVSRADVWIKAYEPNKKKNGEDEEVEDSEILREVKRLRAEESSSSYRDDAVAKVLGPDPRGRVRGFGFGATPSKVDGQLYMHDKVCNLETEIKGLKDQIAMLLARLDGGRDNNEKENSIAQHSANEEAKSKEKSKRSAQHSGTHIQRSKQQKAGSVHHSIDQAAQSSQNEGSGIRSFNNEGAKCEILNWTGKDEVVATGEIASTDPKALAHFVPIGQDCWKVWVYDVLNENAPLFRPTRDIFALNDALGSTIAWPISFIRLC